MEKDQRGEVTHINFPMVKEKPLSLLTTYVLTSVPPVNSLLTPMLLGPFFTTLGVTPVPVILTPPSSELFMVTSSSRFDSLILFRSFQK